MVMGDDKPPYFGTGFHVPDAVGLDPLRADVECMPGILMRLKVIDKETGKTPRGADAAYWPLHPNPHVGDFPGFAPVRASRAYSRGIRQDDGSFLLGVLPGPGAVVVGRARDQYRPACVDPKAFFHVKATKENAQDWLYGDRTNLYITDGDDSVGGLPQEQYSAIILVNPPVDSGPITAEAVLERDRKREVRLLDPDGQPLDGVTAEGEGAEATGTPGVMTVSKLNPMRPRRFIFRHDGRKLVGFLLARGDEAEPYTVRLQPWGTIVGRLVEAEGRPRPRAHLMTTDWGAAMNDPARGILGARPDQTIRADSASMAWSPASPTGATRWARRLRPRASAS